MLLEQSIIENIAKRKELEMDEAARKKKIPKQRFNVKKKKKKKAVPKKAVKKTKPELMKIRRARLLRKGKPVSPKRSKAMRKVWKTKRKQMMRGWKTRKRLYGPSGRLAEEALLNIQQFLMDVKDNKVLVPEDYETFKESVGNYVIAVSAGGETSPQEVYEAVLFNVSPVQAIVEGIADRDDQEVIESDIENIDRYFSYLDEEDEDNDGDDDIDDDVDDDVDDDGDDELPEGTIEFLQDFSIDIDEDATYEDVLEALEDVEFNQSDLDEDEIEILKALDLEENITE